MAKRIISEWVDYEEMVNTAMEEFSRKVLASARGTGLVCTTVDGGTV